MIKGGWRRGWTWRRVWRMAAIAYAAATLPVCAVLLQSEYLRFHFYETVAGYWQKVQAPRYVFIGDSLTASGRNWGLRLDGNPLISRTFAANGYTTYQLQAEAARAAALRPAWIFIMAGTNDVSEENYTRELVLQRYRRILEAATTTGAVVVVTLAPYQVHTDNNERLAELNTGVATLARELGARVIDLNPVIAPQGVLLNEFTVDGVHFSPRGLAVWSDAIRQLLRSDTATEKPGGS